MKDEKAMRNAEKTFLRNEWPFQGGGAISHLIDGSSWNTTNQLKK